MPVTWRQGKVIRKGGRRLSSINRIINEIGRGASRASYDISSHQRRLLEAALARD